MAGVAGIPPLISEGVAGVEGAADSAPPPNMLKVGLAAPGATAADAGTAGVPPPKENADAGAGAGAGAGAAAEPPPKENADAAAGAGAGAGAAAEPPPKENAVAGAATTAVGAVAEGAGALPKPTLSAGVASL